MGALSLCAFVVFIAVGGDRERLLLYIKQVPERAFPFSLVPLH
jgi:hypothetical protein